jgi:DNA mismatch endonuclease, patch repair protein
MKIGLFCRRNWRKNKQGTRVGICICAFMEMSMDVALTALSIGRSMDTRSPEQRSYIMRSVRSRDTGPELIVRRLLHRMGLRFSLHRKDLPGRPDIVLPKHRAVVFVHGCFWHGHGCAKGRLPKSRLSFWGPKIRKNRSRDAESVKMLKADAWRVMTIWQCETKDMDRLNRRLAKFFVRRRDSARKRTQH